MQDQNQLAIQEAVRCLSSGGVLLYLSDTIWGLGCDARNEAAVRRIFKLKKREHSKPLISLVSDLEMLKNYAPDMHPRIETLLHFHRRPVTVVHPNVDQIVFPAKAINGNAAIRIVALEPLNSLIREFGSAITSTSANISGEAFPTCYKDVSDPIKKGVDFIWKSPDYESPRQPSSVITYDDKGELIVLRE